jgi:hypothetical protein
MDISKGSCGQVMMGVGRIKALTWLFLRLIRGQLRLLIFMMLALHSPAILG